MISFDKKDEDSSNSRSNFSIQIQGVDSKNWNNKPHEFPSKSLGHKVQSQITLSKRHSCLPSIYSKPTLKIIEKAQSKSQLSFSKTLKETENPKIKINHHRNLYLNPNIIKILDSTKKNHLEPPNPGCSSTKAISNCQKLIELKTLTPSFKISTKLSAPIKKKKTLKDLIFSKDRKILRKNSDTSSDLDEEFSEELIAFCKRVKIDFI